MRRAGGRRKTAGGKTECGEFGPGDAVFSPPPARPASYGPGGFTLLEVMVAVAILAMVLVSLLGLKNRSTQDVALAQHITTATLLAKRKMTETLVTARTGVITQKEDEGDFPEDEFKGYTWKLTIAPSEFEKTLLEIHVVVLWKEGSRQEQVELVSYE